MKAIFVELTPFRSVLSSYLTDEQYRDLQSELMQNPEKGDVIKHTGGLRKARFGDPRRQKGKRGGLRVIYHYWATGAQFWMFLIYGKDEMNDLSMAEAKELAGLLRREVELRTMK
jgi:hypothetical protein